MINLEKILFASEAEIASATKISKGHRLTNLVRDVDVYRCLSSQKIEGEFLFSASGIEDQAVSIEWVEGVCYVSGINSAYETIYSGTIQKDETALLRALHEKIKSLKAGEEIIKDPFFIVGPPGTGKTKTISCIVEEAISMGKRVLVVSPTNMAVENVFERLDFKKMGLVAGEALLTVKMENESLFQYSPSSVAENKLKPISDELELLESAMGEINRIKRDAGTILESIVAEEEGASILLANITKDESRVENALKKSSASLDEIENRLALINSNALVKSVAGAFLGGKIAELESEKILAISAIETSKKELEELTSKKAKALSSRSNAAEKLQDAKEALNKADASKKEVEARIEVLKKEKEEIIDLNLFGTAKLVGATLMAAALNRKINEASFDLIIVDEASMASLPALLLACKAVETSKKPNEVEMRNFEGLYQAQSDAVSLSLGRQFVFVGDPKQLSPIAKTKEMRKSIFEVYGVEGIFKGEEVSHAILLDINFRNHPDIVALSSKLFYGGMLKSGREHNGKKSLFIRNIKGACSSYEGSYVNHASANAVFEQTAQALAKGRRSVGIITPYRKQAENIDSRMNELRGTYPDADMQAGTVHRFQGKEKGVVMFDITASSGSALPATYCGDIDSEAGRLLNVAMTRAEDFFVLVGDVDGLQKQLQSIDKHESLALWQWISGIKDLAYG